MLKLGLSRAFFILFLIDSLNGLNFYLEDGIEKCFLKESGSKTVIFFTLKNMKASSDIFDRIS